MEAIGVLDAIRVGWLWIIFLTYILEVEDFSDDGWDMVLPFDTTEDWVDIPSGTVAWDTGFCYGC